MINDKNSNDFVFLISPESTSWMLKAETKLILLIIAFISSNGDWFCLRIEHIFPVLLFVEVTLTEVGANSELLIDVAVIFA